MRVFLTGGTGLVGSHVAERLRDAGHVVLALHREAADVAHLAGLGCRLVPGDVRDAPEALAVAMRDCDAVVHSAALVYAGVRWPALRAVNVEGTTRVVRAAALAGIPHAVHISSVAVYAGAVGPVDEETAIDLPLPAGDLYARSKREAEAAARREADAGAVALTLLRPAAVYGERDRLLAPRVAALARRRLVPLLGGGRNTLPIVYAGNVAAAVQRCLELPPSGGVRVYDLGLDHPLSQENFILGMARALGHGPRPVRLPAGLVRGVAEVGQRLGLTVPGAGDLSLARFARLALEQNPYPSRRIRRDLGWNPPFGHDDALARTASWLRREGAAAEGGG